MIASGPGSEHAELERARRVASRCRAQEREAALLGQPRQRRVRSLVHEDRADRDLIEDARVLLEALVDAERHDGGHGRDRQEGRERHRAIRQGEKHDVPGSHAPSAKAFGLLGDECVQLTEAQLAVVVDADERRPLGPARGGAPEPLLDGGGSGRRIDRAGRACV